MTTERAWEIRNGKAADAPLVEQCTAWEMEADRLEDLCRRGHIKSPADWRNLQDAQQMRQALRDELLTPAKAA